MNLNMVRGTMFRLKTKGYEQDVDVAHSPLGQKVDRSKMPLSKFFSRRTSIVPRRQSLISLNKTPHERVQTSDPIVHEELDLLGHVISDWSERGFELCPTTCELRYHTNKLEPGDKESKYAPSMISVGFVQQHTTVSIAPPVQTIDRHLQTSERLSFYTLEIAFFPEHSIHPTYCILGHPDESERDRWQKGIEALMKKKAELHSGWERFREERSMENSHQIQEWMKSRTGNYTVQLNAGARRKARLMNGKVLQDVPKIFNRFSEECPEWPLKMSDIAAGGWIGARRFAMDISNIAEALAELGLDLSPNLARRIINDVRRNPPCPDIPDKIDLSRFELIFRSCCVEFLVCPSDDMKENLLRIMQDSKNSFLSVLSPAEQKYLIEGKDAEGRYFCMCRSYPKDTVLVQQGDEGDSMFIIIEGNLSVVVTFGAGSATVQKEVAILAPGSVMGEISLVLGKPRSATCMVKSESASVAEISKTAMSLLLNGRPSLARELEDIVYRRDTANYLNAGNNAAAMAAYRERGANRGDSDGAAAPRSHGGGGGVDGGGQGSRPPTGSRPRIQSRLGKVPLRRPQSSLPSLSRTAVRAAAGGDGSRPATPGGGVISPVDRPTAGTYLPVNLQRPVTAIRVGARDPGQGTLSRGGGSPLGTMTGPAAGQRVKSGRWIKCRGIYVFVVD